MASIKGTTRILTSFLKPGGTLIVVDLVRKENTLLFHDEAVSVLDEEADKANKEHDHGQESRAHDHSLAHGPTDSQPKPLIHDHIVAHKGGFVEGDIRTAFAGAGLHDFEWKSALKIQPRSALRSVELFLAKGRR